MTDDLMGDIEQENLIDVEHDWQEQWRGMPEYSHSDLQPKQTLLVHFRTDKDRADFAQLVGQHLHAKTKFIWHPRAEIRKASDKVYTSTKVTPRYPIYIISKNRADTRLTQKCFEEFIHVPYHIVIEPQDLEQYARVMPREKIIVLPFSNLGQGSIPARNFVWDHAVATGAKRHWIFDDNISGFCRFQDNLKVEVDSGILHCAIEDWVDRYEDVAMAAFNYDYFAPRKQGAKIKPITLNTRCYSGILLRNDLTNTDGTPMRWRGRYNEDTDLSLRILKDGHCTVLFNAFLMYKKPTLTMKGGNADELYKGSGGVEADWQEHCITCQQCASCNDGYDSRLTPCDVGRSILSRDGRWLMAESLREQHPDCTTVERKFGSSEEGIKRWQHSVDYRAFGQEYGRNVLKLRSDADLTNIYDLTLDAMPLDDARPRPIQQSQLASSKPTISALSFIRAVQPVPAGPEPSLEKSSPTSEQPALASPQPESRPQEPETDFDPVRFKAELALNSHRLLTRDGKFFVSESSSLTDVERATIKQHREQLIPLATVWLEPLVVEQMPADTSETLFEEARSGQTLAQFLDASSPTDYVPDEPPDLTGIDEVVLNFATTGLNWAGGDRPCGVTVSTLDGQLCRFLPFGFADGNLSEETVKRWALEQLRGKKIVNSKTKFDVHVAREWGIDLEEQGCTFSDVQHTAALLDDRRKRFSLDLLAADYFPGEQFALRLDETQHHRFTAAQAAERERATARLVGRLRAVMDPEISKQELRAVHDLEDAVIPTVVEMEKNGSPIDVLLLEQYGRECMAEHDRLLWEVSRECGFAFEHTAAGWKRLIESLHLVVPDSFSESVLNEVDHPLVRKGQRASQYASLNSKIFKAYPEHIQDGVLRYNINQLASDDGGTVSGRFSIGIVQQVPNAYNHGEIFGDELFPRRLFVPGSGEYFEGDAAQIEFRLLVQYSGNAKLLQAYKDDPWMSFHKKMQEMLVAYKPDMNYTHTKSYNFAAQYGAKSIKLAVMMGFISERVGEEIRRAKRWDDPRLKTIKEIEAAYKKAHPEAGALLDRASHLMKNECDEYCKKNDILHRQFQHRGYVKTLLGRRSRCVNNYKPYIGLNRVLQGTGADIMKQKLVELHAQRKEIGFILRITNHDAVLGDATTPETKEKVSAILNAQSFPLKVPILWECGTGKNWADCK
jgi:DNA polymerase I-like protein with 3'-5' exonuclease and polymerase domains